MAIRKTRYIVCYMLRKPVDRKNVFSEPTLFSDYDCFETLKETKAFYKTLLERRDTYSASITKILKSTDYF